MRMTNAEILMRKGARCAAALIQAECVSSSSSSHLSVLLDHLLDPDKDLSSGEAMEWCRWLVGGGESYEDFSMRVKTFDITEKCGLVWTADFVAFRCRTCGISQCMSLCADCFQEGNHEGHDFNMFKSQAGGACDCGDSSVMRPSGFCCKHRQPPDSSSPTPPQELMLVSSNIVPRIILRLVQHLRVNSIPSTTARTLSPAETLAKYEKTIENAEGILVLLHDFSSLGAAMRAIMTNCLIDRKIYCGLTSINNDSQYANFMRKSQNLYEDAVEDLPNVSSNIPIEHKDYIIDEKLKHHTFLEELVFWTVKYEFPELLNCLLLKMLPDATYKEAFTRSFVMHYSRVSLTLSQSSNSDRLSNRVVHVSVQLFSNEKLALSMAENFQLLHVMVSSLVYNMMSKVLIKCTLHSPRSDHMVVDCMNHITKDHCYWPLVSDLSNVLSHQPIALKFMSDNGLLSMWFGFLQMLQGMNVNERELEAHIEFEPSTYYASFSAELEASASPMWALISHLKDKETGQYTVNVIKHCVVALLEWFKVNNFTSPSQCNIFKVSFHIPLHRYFSMFVRQGVICHGFSLKELLPEPEILSLVMAHPLRVQTAFYEIMCGIWVRNGLQIKGQAMTYLQCHFCKSMVDADIFLLQVCATQLPPLHFLSTILERFQMDDWLTFSSAYKFNRIKMDREQVIPMIESCLTFIVSLLVLRSNLGLSETDLARLEMVTLLCMGDKQHSKLFDSIPEKSANPIHIELFGKVLLEVGQYREPQFEAGGNMQQGIYLPKPNVWDNLYDPIYVLLRAVHRRDFQTSIDRFTEYAKNKYSNDTERLKTIDNPWPPWRLPSPCHQGFDDPRRLLHSRFFHGLIFNILYKAVHDEEVMVSEHIISLTIFLLELALTYPQDGYSGKEIAISKPWLIVHKPTDLKYDTWFPTDWLSANLRHVVSAVFIPPTIGGYNDQSKSNPIVPTNFQDLLPSMQMEVDNIDSLNSSASSSSESNFFTSSPFIMPKNALTYSYSSCSLTLDNRGVVLSNTKDHLKMPAANKNKYSVTLQEESENYSSTSSQSVIAINESIITLMLKLHSKLSKIPDSYIPIHNRTGLSTTSSYRSSRIGNGCFFIEKVLDLIVEFDEMCKQSVSACRTQIWPSYHNDEAVKEQSFERKEAEIRRKKAKQRQKQMMEQLAAQQRRFMANVERGNEVINLLDAESESKIQSNCTSISNQFSPTYSSNEKQEVYDCVHCHLTTVSTEEKPIGLVVLLQATSVLSHMHYESSKLILPTCDDEQYLLNNHSLGIEYENQFQELSRHFSSDSYLLAQSRGWAGGIHIQSCGHRVHLSCRQSYMEHLRSQQRSENNHVLDVEHGEYMCPMCRQLANSILPIPPNINESSLSLNSPSSEEGLTNLAEKILFLSNEKTFFEDNRFDKPICSRGATRMTPLKRAMSQLMEQFPKATLLQYQPSSSNRSAHVIFVFVSSIARINLELDLIQRGGTLIGKNNEAQSPSTGVNPFKTCFVPLLHVLSNHVKTTCPIDLSREWIEITGLESATYSSHCYENYVPLILQDCTTLFLHFLLMLPIQLDIVLFETLTKAHFNLQLIQSMARASCLITDVERERMRSYSLKSSIPSTFSEYLGRIVEYLGTNSFYKKVVNKIINEIVDIESHVQKLTLPFLRIVAIVRHYLYSEPLPEINHLNDEFTILVKFLHLNNYPGKHPGTLTIKCLNWFSKRNARIHAWFKEFESLSIKNTSSSFRLLCKNTLWAQPQLLRLPKTYDAIFQFYHKKECGVCHQVPKDPSICLLCGVLVCFKESCCRFGGNSNNGMCEAIRHSFDCGAGTAMFLAVNSSYIVVVRGRRACVWGSIYLDSFGEEDKELKRGRPLFLNDERYNLLQQQWINHRFSHNNRTWIWHWNQL